MVTYSALDPDLNRWAAKLGVAWARIYKDEEVRSLDVDIGLPRKAQIWIELSDDDSRVEVKAWDRKKRQFSETTSISQLCEALDRALSQVTHWKNNAHTA